MVAPGAVDGLAAATEPFLDQLGIYLRIDLFAGNHYLRACLMCLKVTAVVGGRRIEMQHQLAGVCGGGGRHAGMVAQASSGRETVPYDGGALWRDDG